MVGCYGMFLLTWEFNSVYYQSQLFGNQKV